MKLAAKLVSIVILGLIAILVIDGYLSVERDVEIFEAGMKSDAHLFGSAMAGLVSLARQSGDASLIRRLISEADRGPRQLRIRLVRLNALPGDPDAPGVTGADLAPLLKGQELSLKERDREGHLRLYTYVPVPGDGTADTALEISESLSGLEKRTRDAWIGIFILTGTLAAVSGLAAVLLGFVMVGRPLHRLIEKVRRVGKGDLTGPLDAGGGDEFSELAGALNAMCEHLDEARRAVRTETEARIEAMEQLRHADRLKTVGGLASGIAHELGTPLNVVSGRAALIASGKLPEEEIAGSAAVIKAQTDRITTIIRQLLDFARRNTPRKTAVDLGRIVDRTLELMAPLARERGVGIRRVGETAPVPAMADGGQIEQALTNLIVNAVQAMPGGGGIEVGIRHEHVRPPAGHGSGTGKHACIDVVDEGEGISDKDMERLFEPFFTTKDVGKGTGLGLSIAYGIVEEHGGWIGVTSEKGKGSRFTIYLPEEGG